MKSGARLRLRCSDPKELVGSLVAAQQQVKNPAGSIWYIDGKQVVLSVMDIEFIVPETALAAPQVAGNCVASPVE